MSDGQLWDRMPDETAKAYRAFTAYRDMGPGRTIRAAAKSLGRSRSLLNEWSAKYNWVSRAEAYDAWQRAVAQAGYEQGVREEAARWARRQQDARLREFSIGRALLGKAAAMLRFPLAQAVIQEDEEGRVITIIQPAKWSMSDVPRMADVGSKLARLSAEMAVPGGASVPSNVRTEVVNDADYIAAVLKRLDEAGQLDATVAADDEPLRAAPAAPTTGGSPSRPE